MNHVPRQEVLKGTIERWNNDKGFGFITSEHGTSIFFHISEYRPPSAPTIGEEVVFHLGEDKQGRVQAKRVQQAQFVAKKQDQRQQRQKKKAERQQQIQAQKEAFESSQHLKLVVSLLFFSILGGLALASLLPWAVVFWYCALSLATFILYARDKTAAQNGQWRTKESTLHSYSLLGGWVGALLAQNYLRHKSQKAEFRSVFWLTVALNSIGLIGYVFMMSK